jgi:nucleoside-diphosphate-sugar epimerase
MRTDLLVNNFVHQAVTQKTLTVFEKHYKRSFIHVNDIVESILFAMDNSHNMKGEVYNMGGKTNDATKEELALMIKENIDFNLRFNDSGTDEEKRDYNVSFDKINKCGYEIKTTIEEGIKELIHYYLREKTFTHSAK